MKNIPQRRNHQAAFSSAFSNLAINALNLLFPADETCEFCYAEKGACTCLDSIDIFRIKECPICGRRGYNRSPYSPCDPCRLLKKSEIYFDANFCYARYSGALKQAILDMKYNGALHYRDLFGKMLYEKYCDAHLASLHIDAVTYIPISLSRRYSRGFNQAKEIASVFASRAELPLYPLLKRRKKTKKLSTIDALSRASEMKYAMEIIEKNLTIIHKNKILIVDDIFTTGATINEAARCLKKAGAASVFSITVAG